MKKLLALLFFALFLGQLYAQSSMSDTQIIKFIQKEYTEGASQSEIVIKLMQRGVSIQKIRELKRKYEAQKNKLMPGAKNISGMSKKELSRLRQSNDDQNKRSEKLKGNFQEKENEPSIAKMTPEERIQYQLDKERQMGESLDFIVPDTTNLYKKFLKSLKKHPSKRKVFGRNIFNNKYLTFEGNMNIATPPDYVLGAGDNIFVDVWGASQKSFESVVSPDGNIQLEGIGPVSIGGLSVRSANAKIRKLLKRYFSSSNIRLTVGQTKTITVNVMGEVMHPGTYTLSAFSTVFHALYMAGGTNEIGTLRNIKVYRLGKCISTVDIYDYILNGNMKGNVRLSSGDVIIVGPYDCLVDIAGKVKRPMFYEMRSDESLRTLIKYAGGFTGDAYKKVIRVIRKSGGERSIFSVDEFDSSKFQLKDQDSIAIDSALNKYSNMVEIKGAVYRPGMYEVGDDISTVGELIKKAGGITPQAFLNRAILHRRKTDQTLRVISLNLKAILAHNIPDVTLKNEDVLYIPSTKEMQDERTLTIKGEVNYPGVYEYADSTSLEDLVLQAGGLKDAASLVKVDVSRRIRNNTALRAGNMTAKIYSFQLRDGFVVNGKPEFILKPFDEVYVRKSPGYIPQEHIDVEGEVNFEGTYTLAKKGSRLSDIIKLAGGLTPEAYTKGARLERKLNPEEKLKQTMMLKMIQSEDSTNLSKIEMGDTKNIGINLDMALKYPGNDQWDIVLQPDDRLIVPQYNNTVSINGEVMYPNTVAYKEGENLKYYINQVGGFSTKAYKHHVFAVNMNGTVTRVRKASDIQPGCEIVIPAKEKHRKMTFAEILSLGSITTTMAAILVNLIKK